MAIAVLVISTALVVARVLDRRGVHRHRSPAATAAADATVAAALWQITIAVLTAALVSLVSRAGLSLLWSLVQALVGGRPDGNAANATGEAEIERIEVLGVMDREPA